MEEKAVDKELADNIAQTERIGLGDLVIAGIIGAVSLVLMAFWSYDGLHPSVWNDAAAACGLRPAEVVMPGYYRAAAMLMYKIFGIGRGFAALNVLGYISLAVIAVTVYATLREVLAFVMRARPQKSKRRTIVMQLASAVGAVAFLCSDAVWTAGQAFSETTIMIALSLAAVEFFFAFLRKGSLGWAYVCAITLGILSAESPMGIVLTVFFCAMNSVVLKNFPMMQSPFYDPAVIAVGKWHMTFFYVGALAFGIAVNCYTFVERAGLDVGGLGIGSVPLAYARAYWGTVTSAATPMGWALLLGVGVIPFVITLMRFPAAADEEMFLPYVTGLVFLVCGIVSFASSSPLPALWFWNYGPVNSQYLLSFVNLLNASTLAASVTILGVDALCRDHQRLANEFYGRDEDDMPVKVIGANNTVRRFMLIVIPLGLIAAMIPSREKAGTRGMLELIRDLIRETVVECGDAKYVFTDGNLDSALELESASRGNQLLCLSLMGRQAPYDVYLRTRGMENDEEDMFSFKVDTGMGLRSWMHDRTNKLDRCAVQVGFDLWKRNGNAIPPIGGLVSRPNGFPSEQVRLDGVERAHKLSERVLKLQADGDYENCHDPIIKKSFIAAQWRLARMCTYRAERLDLAGQVQAAIEEMDLAKRLNDCNETFQKMAEQLDRNNELLLKRLTPREGLQLALVRADFSMGRIYAETILSADPTNPDANFAMGMAYLQDRQLGRSAEYLKRCLIRNPREPAIYNNLAMIDLELGKLDAALVNVRKALAIIPDSAAVKDTEKAILKAIEEQKKKAEEKK